MAKSTKVVIDGKEYSLVGDDENLIRKTAGQVDSQIEFLNRQNKDLPPTTISILAALNISEENIKLKSELSSVNEFIIKELNEMSEYLKKTLQS